MPTYVYKFVETGETIEVQQSFADESLTEYTHPSSGEVMSVKKVFQPVGVTFKGSGFFKNDNRGKQSTTSAATSDGSSSDTSSGDSKSSDSKSSDSKSGDSKSGDSKPATSSDSSGAKKSTVASSSSSSSGD